MAKWAGLTAARPTPSLQASSNAVASTAASQAQKAMGWRLRHQTHAYQSEELSSKNTASQYAEQKHGSSPITAVRGVVRLHIDSPCCCTTLAGHGGCARGGGQEQTRFGRRCLLVLVRERHPSVSCITFQRATRPVTASAVPGSVA
ncbi:hypothetical protein J1614_003986 [Plenodomus biglobosus]|nr:hypothetical protein J1614_003986 [Plenodomus biglobosus]